MKAHITITITVRTDGPLADVDAIASQLEMCLETDFELDTIDLLDNTPTLTVGNPEIEIAAS